MCFFRKKSQRQKLLNNKHDIEDMASSVDVLISLANANTELVDLLKQIQDKIKYFNPTENKDALDLDKKINNRLGDLKIDINKAKSKDDYSKAIELSKDLLEVMIVERTSKANRRK